MGHELGRTLLLADAVTPDGLSRALFTAIRDKVSLVRALLETDAVDPERLEEELAREAPDAPLQRHPVPVPDLLDRLPERLCEALLALPVRRDPRTGTVDVALADALDTHAADEIAFYLGAPVRVVRSPLAAIEEAITRLRAPRISSPSILPPPPAFEPTNGVALEPYPQDHPAHVSERPRPLVKLGSEPAPDEPAPFELRKPTSLSMSQEDIPIPLSRRMFIPKITAQSASDEEEPVVELRRSKTPAERTPRSIRPDFPTPPPLQQILREMARATARDPLMELMLQAVRPVAPKSALFAVKREAFVGFMCTSEFGDRAALGEVRVDLSQPSIFATAAATGTFQGPLLRNGPHTSLFHFVKPSAPDVIAVAVRAAGKPVVIALAHDLAGTQLAMGVMTEVARVAGEALEKIVLSARTAALTSRR